MVASSLRRERSQLCGVGERVLDWVFDRDEHAWASYWLIFVGPQSAKDGGAPAQQLAEAHAEMRKRRAAGA